MAGKVWTPDEDARLLNLAKDGRNGPDMARALRVCRSTIERRIRTLRARGVDIVTAAEQLRRRNRQNRAAKMAASRRTGGTVIPCLCCLKQFRSEGKHNRLCSPCKQRGGSMSVFDAPAGNGCRNVVMGG